jgi:hypothetical protein
LISAVDARTFATVVAASKAFAARTAANEGAGASPTTSGKTPGAGAGAAASKASRASPCEMMTKRLKALRIFKSVRLTATSEDLPLHPSRSSRLESTGAPLSLLREVGDSLVDVFHSIQEPGHFVRYQLHGFQTYSSKRVVERVGPFPQ